MKVNNCCFCVELRIGCIILAVVGIVLSILGVGLSSGWSSILSLILAIAANCCLLYSAAYTKGSTKSRSITALIYIVFVLISAVFLVIQAVLLIIHWGRVGQNHGQYASALVTYIILILLDLYFSLVAYSWYQDLKGVVVVNNA